MIFLCVMVRLLITRVFGSFPPRAKEAIPHAETRCFEDGVGAPFADGVFAAPAAFYGRVETHMRGSLHPHAMIFTSRPTRTFEL